MKKCIYKYLFFISFIFLCGFNSYRDDHFDGKANIISAKTPVDENLALAKWYKHFSDDYYYTTSMTSTPIVTSKYIYVVNADMLYELDMSGNITRSLKLFARMNSVCHPVLSGDDLYIPISGGVVQCVDIKSFSSVWVKGDSTEAPSNEISASMGVSSGYQSLCPLIYYDGYLYSGTWIAKAKANTETDISSDGYFYCLDADTGKIVWTYRDESDPCGFYWNQGVVYGDAIWFMAEDGRLVSHSLKTDEVYETHYLDGSKTMVRAGLCLAINTDEYTYTDEKTADACLYTVSKEGKVFKIDIDAHGAVKKIYGADLFEKTEDEQNKITSCTCTPTVYKDRLYVGCYHDGYAYMCIRSADLLSAIDDVLGNKSSEIKSPPLVSTFEEENTNSIYLYFTSNDADGALYMMKDILASDEGRKIVKLFSPSKDKQYCIGCVAAGDDGTLYYSNDSGTLFAISSAEVSADVTIEDITVKKPGSLKVSYKKNSKKKRVKAILSWKNKEKNIKTEIYIKIDKKSFKKIAATSKEKYSIKLSKYKGKKVYVRLRAIKRKDGKTYRSKYTKKKRII